ncbi:hypothetical protein HFN76_36145 [Rhizobium laguerreae]|uniref:hypothetical protein n=1 Tax=Rhizobium laguerreae TaxID=1076926 RepID=UPI001C913B6D|nr:hypothetical protein [Rhizobium laguerreae]MBY3517456.1 hypothetical protein [Rhizobium laguerreae]
MVIEIAEARRGTAAGSLGGQYQCRSGRREECTRQIDRDEFGSGAATVVLGEVLILIFQSCLLVLAMRRSCHLAIDTSDDVDSLLFVVSSSAVSIKITLATVADSSLKAAKRLARR